MKKITDVAVILASTSPRRHQLLDLIGIQHQVAPSDVEETQLPGEEPAAYAERLARAKAEAIAASTREALVIGADTIVVIDDDLGCSGSSADTRPGFQRLVAEVGLGRVGIIIGAEVSRLARSCSDWYQLLEICALADTLIADDDGVYDPTS